MRYHIVVLIIFFIIYSIPMSLASSDVYLETDEKTNYSEGIGNITYPSIMYQTEKKSFGNNLLVGDVNGDGNMEIIGASLLDNELCVYNNNLSLMWEFKEKSASNWSALKYGKITSLALGDIDGNGVPEIIFSIAPSICPIDTPIKIEKPFSVIYAFKGDGTLLWNITVSGGITQDTLEISDINQDGKKEIIAGGTYLYLISNNGTIISEYDFSNQIFRGISEIATHGNEIVYTYWHYPDVRRAYNNLFRVSNSFYNIEKIIFSNNSFQKVWSIELESDDSITSPQYQRFFAMENFSISYISKEYISPNMPDALVCINLTSGKIKWTVEEYSTQQTGIGVAVLQNEVVWNTGNRVIIVNSNGEKIANYSMFGNGSTIKMVRPTITIFDVDADGRKEMVFTDANYIYSFDMKKGTKEWGQKLWSGAYVCPIDAPILHADTDNDGFDEIITTDPEGRIVTIDNGTPPQNIEEGINTEILIAGSMGAIITASSVIWVWRKGKNEGEK